MPKRKITLSCVSVSFADGTRLCFVEKRVEETDVLAEALWLENHGRIEEAERLLDEYCAHAQYSPGAG